MPGILQSDMTGGMRDLADLLGIVWDRDGTPLSDDQLSAALDALGWSAEDSSELQILVDAEARRQWLSSLPTAVLAQADQPIAVPVRTADPTSTAVTAADDSGDEQTLTMTDEITGTSTVTADGASEVRHEYTARGPAFPAGTGEVRCSSARGVERAPLVVSPPEIRLPDRSLSVHLAAARMGRSWGVGDFADLKDIVVTAAQAGVQAIVTTPVTAGRSEDPFDPESRCALDPLYISVTETLEYGVAAPSTRDAVRALGIDLVESSSFNRPLEPELVRERKLRALLALYEVPARPSRQAEFARFRERCGAGVSAWALYRAMQMDSRAPESSDAREVHIFKEERSDVIDFWLWVQFIAREQFEAAVTAPQRIGRSLRVAVQLPGAGKIEQWARPTAVVSREETGLRYFKAVQTDRDELAWTTEMLADTAYLLAGAVAIAGADLVRVPAGDDEAEVADPVLPRILGAELSRFGGALTRMQPMDDLADIMGDFRPRAELPWKIPVAEAGKRPMTSRSLSERMAHWAQKAD